MRTRIDLDAGGFRFGALPPLLALVALLACGPGDQPARTGRSGAGTPDPVSTLPLAVYNTTLTFVGFAPEPALLHLRLENRTEPGRLQMEYRGWVAGDDGWRPVLAAVDSIPVPRAAWRIVPSGPLRLGVEDGGELSSLRIDLGPEGPLRVDALEEVSAWSGVTGRRETLRLADLQVGERVETGWLLQRQRARLSEERSGERVIQTFVLGDTLGNGLLILRDRAFPEAPATVWAWMDGVRLDWTDAVLLALPGGSNAVGSWSFEVREVGAFGEITGAEPLLDALPAEGTGFRAFRVRASFVVGEERRTLRGMAIEERVP